MNFKENDIIITYSLEHKDVCDSIIGCPAKIIKITEEHIVLHILFGKCLVNCDTLEYRNCVWTRRAIKKYFQLYSSNRNGANK